MADESKLSALHDKLAEVLADALDGQQLPDYEDEEGNIVAGTKLQPSAAIMQVASAFLKNNNITCVASEDNALGELQEKMAARQARRQAKSQPSAIDLANASEQAGWLQGKMVGNA